MHKYQPCPECTGGSRRLRPRIGQDRIAVRPGPGMGWPSEGLLGRTMLPGKEGRGAVLLFSTRCPHSLLTHRSISFSSLDI